MPQGPYWLELLPTNECNLNCPSCPRRAELPFKDTELPDSRLASLMEEAADLGVRQLSIAGGGEPFMRRDAVLQVMKTATSRGLQGDLVTNGTMIDDEAIERIVSMGWNRIRFSLDGASPATNDRLRGRKGAFRKTTDCIRAFQLAKRRTGRKEPELAFNTILSAGNFRELDRIMTVASELDVPEVQVFPMTVFSEAGAKQVIPESDYPHLNASIHRAMETAERLSVRTNVREYLQNDLVRKTNRMNEMLKDDVADADMQDEHPFVGCPCYDPFLYAVVAPDGTTGPCCSGEINRTPDSLADRSLASVWFGDKFARVRERRLRRILDRNCRICCTWKIFAFRELRDGLRQYLRTPGGG